MLNMPTTETFTDLTNVCAPGVSWGEVAKLTGTSPRTIWRLRHGLLVRPTRGTLQSIAVGYGCPLARVEAAVAVSRQQQVAARKRRRTARV
jgi:transcriptional regulator with XRE-family HTH domain